MQIFLQVWGGSFYLLAKVFLAHAEGKSREENFKWRARGWMIYLLGVPPWVILLAEKRNWITMAIEAGGIPAMILGIAIATKNLEDVPLLLDKSTKVFMQTLVLLGIIYSVYDFCGIVSFSQILECGVTTGFLIGTSLLYKKDRRGWIWFMLMNISMGALAALQGRWILAVLQAISLCFVISGFTKSRKVAN